MFSAMFLFIKPSISSFVIILLLLTSSLSLVEPASGPGTARKPVSAIYVFGDSTSDPGNNNFITTPFKSNFAPYGRDFPNHIATGRFTNGRLTTDFIAKYVGVKELVPPYLNKSLNVEELMTGVSFASAGSGYDPLTPTLSGVIPMSKQLDYFKEYRSMMDNLMGVEKVNQHLSKAIFLISAGTNDFVVNYFTIPIRRKMYTVTQYQQFLVQNVHQFIESLWKLGARKMAVVGLPPMGCLPVVITAKSKSLSQRGCIDSLSSISRDYNKLLEAHLVAMQLTLGDPPTKFVYVDIYSPVDDLVHGLANGNSNYSFEHVSSGCCGTGYLETAYLCNSASYVCSDASNYVFWDSIHPTEITYYLIFKSLRPLIDFLIAN